MFILRVVIIKMSKIAEFFVFSADDRKKSVTVCTDYLSTLGRSYRVLSENGIFNRLWSYRL